MFVDTVIFLPLIVGRVKDVLVLPTDLDKGDTLGLVIVTDEDPGFMLTAEGLNDDLTGIGGLLPLTEVVGTVFTETDPDDILGSLIETTTGLYETTGVVVSVELPVSSS